MSTYTLFALNQIRSRPKATPEDIYRYFHKHIQDEQIKEITILKKALDIIDKEIRRINIVTEDESVKTSIREQTNLLLKIDREIREAHAKQGADFLKALDIFLRYNPTP